MDGKSLRFFLEGGDKPAGGDLHPDGFDGEGLEFVLAEPLPDVGLAHPRIPHQNYLYLVLLLQKHLIINIKSSF